MNQEIERFPFETDALPKPGNEPHDVQEDLKPEATQEAPRPSIVPMKKELTPIALREGYLQPVDAGEAMRVAKMIYESGLAPKSLNSVNKVFLAYCGLKALGLAPEISIRQTMVFNDTFHIWGDLPKACVDRSGLLENFVEELFDKDQKVICFNNKNLGDKPWGAFCRVKRRGMDSVERYFTLEQATAAGLMSKDTWKKYPFDMLRYRARSRALKDAFPDILQGVAITEFDASEAIDVTGKPSCNVTEEINNTYLGAGDKEKT